MLHYTIIFLSILNCKTTAQHSYQIEDIPIEHFVHEDIQQDEIDVELMPKYHRFLPSHEITINAQEDDNAIYQNSNNSRSKRDTKTKPIEIPKITNENTKIKTNQSDVKTLKEGSKGLLINDFIRFRRDTGSNSPTNQNNLKRVQTGGKFVQRLPDGALAHLSDFNGQKDVTREARGAVKEQWVKQTYPVERNDEDNLQVPSRAPRVHFVTNGMSERDLFIREPRSGAVNKYSPSDLDGEMDYYQPRVARNYAQRSSRYYDRYPTDHRDYYKGQNYLETPLNYNPTSSRQRRIIYYATLPEISRNSRNDDLRRPYYYRDRYFEPEQYDGYRKRYFDYPRYANEDRQRDLLYPIKVSTDVNVREIRKNPEKRIYSDVDRTSYTQN